MKRIFHIEARGPNGRRPPIPYNQGIEAYVLLDPDGGEVERVGPASTERAAIYARCAELNRQIREGMRGKDGMGGV